MSDSVDRPFRDEADIRRFLVGLIDLWDRDCSKVFEFKSDYAVTVGPMILSLTHHAVELSKTILELSISQKMFVAIPLIRLVMDNAMTVAWLSVAPQSDGALIHESLRQRRNAVENIIKVGGEGFDESTLKEAADELERFADMKSPQGQNVEQRFKALVGGEQTYSLYRIASSLSHAGMTLADQYLVEMVKSEDAPLGIGFAPDKRVPYSEAWMGTTVSMVVLAMTVCDGISSKGQKKHQLEKARKRLGMEMRVELV